MRNGPLDMRMDPRSQLTAATIVNEYSEEQLTRLFRELGEEPAARRIASLIVKMRKSARFAKLCRWRERLRSSSVDTAVIIRPRKCFKRCAWK
jgi:Predicted S-adenosylmethionine-dependent methyltransferase involved in cell envelope biogenesis